MTDETRTRALYEVDLDGDRLVFLALPDGRFRLLQVPAGDRWITGLASMALGSSVSTVLCVLAGIPWQDISPWAIGLMGLSLLALLFACWRRVVAYRTGYLQLALAMTGVSELARLRPLADELVRAVATRAAAAAAWKDPTA